MASPVATQPIGMKVGNYVINESIGAGGMGAVYRAEHPEIGRKVAVKLLPRHLGMAPGLADRFRAEARAVTRIEHPNIIDIYDYGQTDDGQLYIIMELLRGHELVEEIRKYAPMPPIQVLPFLEQICSALQAAHDKGVVHRDLKPENIFVLDRLKVTVKVLDFGLAKLLDDTNPGASQTVTGQIMGTPITIAPEQAAGRPQEIGPHTDLYSLGVILYWMLSGKPPFIEQTTALLLAKHISDPAPPLASHLPALNPEIADLVDRCLLKPPAERPVSARAIYSRFAAALDGDEPTAVARGLPISPLPPVEPEALSATVPSVNLAPVETDEEEPTEVASRGSAPADADDDEPTAVASREPSVLGMDEDEPTPIYTREAFPGAPAPRPPRPADPATSEAGITPSMVGELAHVSGRGPARDRKLLLAVLVLLAVLGAGAYFFTLSGQPGGDGAEAVTSARPAPAAPAVAPKPAAPAVAPKPAASALPDAAAPPVAAKAPAPARKKPARARKIRKVRRKPRPEPVAAKPFDPPTRTIIVPIPPPPPAEKPKPKPKPTAPMGESTVPAGF